jgi:predicted phage terminase large subunit-like protein
MITTRWHEDDVAGRILPDKWDGESGWFSGKDGRRWLVLCLPAICDRADDPLGRRIGETLWPEWFSLDHWKPFQAIERTWASLYQQKPLPPGGVLFKPEQIQIVEALPAVPAEWARGWDFAGTVDGDYTAGPKLGKLRDGRFLIADMVRLRAGPDERDRALHNTAVRDGVNVRISIPQDPGQAGKTQVLDLTRKLAGFRVSSSPESGDKITRAEPFASQVNVGNVLMLRGDWNAALLDELRSFPNGRHDDQVDGLSRAFAELLGVVTQTPAGAKVQGL